MVREPRMRIDMGLPRRMLIFIAFLSFWSAASTFSDFSTEQPWSSWSEWSDECSRLCKPDSTVFESRERHCLSKLGRCQGARVQYRNCSHISSYSCYTEAHFSISQCGTRLRSVSQLQSPIPSKFSQFSKRIINGDVSKAYEFPWLVQFIAYGSYVICTGALISPWCILTAGHCFDDPEIEYVLIAGKYHTDIGEKDLSAQTLKMASYKIHPGYMFDTADNDYAVVTLEEPASVNAFVKPLCLPGKDEELTGDSFCFVAGWGITAYDTFKYPEELRELFLPILPPDVCRTIYNKKLDYFTENMICAGYLHAEGDSCQGDSGAPMVCKRVDGTFFVAGLVSWGNGCAKEGYPGVYAKVSKAIEWILQEAPDL